MSAATQNADCKVVFEFVNTRLILHALQALGLSSKQVLRVVMTPGGVTFRCEDDGKVCQSSVFFPCGFFQHYEISGPRKVFSISLSILLDALKVFAAFPDVVVRATQHEERLVLETAEKDRGTPVCMYAHITVLGAGVFRDLMSFWESPATEFMTAASILKEAVEDLEWPQGPVRVKVEQSPFRVQLKATGNVGTLAIAVPAEAIKNAIAPGACVERAYPYKFMKCALVGLTGSKASVGDITSRVSLDKKGLLKVVHMLGAGASSATTVQDIAVVLTYLIQPMCDDEVD